MQPTPTPPLEPQPEFLSLAPSTFCLVLAFTHFTSVLTTSQIRELLCYTPLHTGTLTAFMGLWVAILV